jgi:hypothetical protein
MASSPAVSLRHHHGGRGRCVISRPPLPPRENCLRLLTFIAPPQLPYACQGLCGLLPHNPPVDEHSTLPRVDIARKSGRQYSLRLKGSGIAICWSPSRNHSQSQSPFASHDKKPIPIRGDAGCWLLIASSVSFGQCGHAHLDKVLPDPALVSAMHHVTINRGVFMANSQTRARN